MTERVTVRPGDGQSLAEVAAALIALADHPHDVVWEHRAGVLTVPEELSARYVASVSGNDTGGAVADAEPPVEEPQPEKRKPGRPKKAAAVKEEVN